MTDDDAALHHLATAVLASCRAAGRMVATAESCTGGLIAATLTAIAGSSDVVDRGFVTYSNAAKTELLGVPPELIASHGAVSEEVAGAMARGALGASNATVAVSTNGDTACLTLIRIAGSPVGLGATIQGWRPISVKIQPAMFAR